MILILGVGDHCIPFVWIFISQDSYSITSCSCRNKVCTNLVSTGARGNTVGILTNEDPYKWDTMVAYTQDQYHVSLSLSKQHEDWTAFDYYSTAAAHAVEEDSNATAYAARAYWRPQESGS